MSSPVLYGLLGYPIEHSKSPAFFNTLFSKEGISAHYALFSYKEIADFLAEIERNQDMSDSLVGFNVTSPHKSDIIPYLHALSPEAEVLQAVNVVKVKHELSIGQPLWYGYNSDVVGFSKLLEHALRQSGNPYVSKALVIGGGGAARSVCYCLKQEGIDYNVVSRTPDAVTNGVSYSSLNEDGVMESFPLIVQCTPLGMTPNISTAPLLPYERINGRGTIAIDLVYSPEITRFMALCQKYGAHTFNGYMMLVEQAKEAWRIWREE